MLAPDAESSPCSLFGLGAVPSPSAAYRTPRAVPLFDNEPAPCAEFVPLMVHEVVLPLEVADCLLPVAEVEIASQAVSAAKTLPNNSAAGSSHTQHPTHMVLGIPNQANAHHSPDSMAHLPPTSAYRPALPPASAHRRQPISPPGKANIVAILKERELDSKK